MQLPPLGENEEEEHAFVEPIESKENAEGEHSLAEEGGVEGTEDATPEGTEGGEGGDGEAAPLEGEEAKGIIGLFFQQSFLSLK